MKERWKLKRADSLMTGDIFWRGNLPWKVYDAQLSKVTGRTLVLSARCSDVRIVLGPSIDDYVPVLLRDEVTPPALPVPPRTMTIADHAKRNLRPGRTVLGAPPEPPEPPPLRYERDPHGFGSWWGQLKDWLNGR